MELHEHAPIQQQAILVSAQIHQQQYFADDTKELQNLATACDIEIVSTLTQKLTHVDSRFYIGKGKLEELALLITEKAANLVIFNCELSPSQLRNIENILECKVVDRTMIILDIFQSRAKTKEAKLQVSIAELQYFLPRLVGLRASLGRQSGGVGTKNKGLGEKKIELDRRRIEHEITLLKQELTTIVQNRQTQRQWRKKANIPTIAIVGYTNAGKSTLMNALLRQTETEEKNAHYVETKDMVFSTLETTSRRVFLDKQTSFILTDTVGFVSNLPHHLIAAFRSTLEEVKDADLLLHVVECSTPYARDMLNITNHTLAEIGIKDIPTFYLYNKIDKSIHNIRRLPKKDSLAISAKNNIGIPQLLNEIKQFILRDYQTFEIQIPYSQPDILAFYHANTYVKHEYFSSDCITIIVHTTTALAQKFEKNCLSIKIAEDNKNRQH